MPEACKMLECPALPPGCVSMRPFASASPYNPNSVEGHQNAVLEAREERRFRKIARERAAVA